MTVVTVIVFTRMSTATTNALPVSSFSSVIFCMICDGVAANILHILEVSCVVLGANLCCVCRDNSGYSVARAIRGT